MLGSVVAPSSKVQASQVVLMPPNYCLYHQYHQKKFELKMFSATAKEFPVKKVAALKILLIWKTYR